MTGDPYRYFRIEVGGLLDQLGQNVIELERNPGAKLVAQLLRLAHTLKGAARVVRLHEIADVAHLMEDELTPWRASGERVPKSTTERLLLLLDQVAGLVASLTSPSSEVMTTDQPGQPDQSRQVDDRYSMVATDVTDIDRLLRTVEAVTLQLAALRRSISTLTPADNLVKTLSTALAGGTGPMSESRRDPTLSTARLFHDLRSTLTTIQRTADDRADEAERGLRKILEQAKQLRLAPAGTVLATLDRVTRDIADLQGKDVVFTARGGRIRLDTYVLSAVTPALVQMVRNAVAHGVETAAVRAKTGKPQRATIAVEVTRRGQRVVFACSDDGGGFDLEAVRRAAVQRKGMDPARTRHLTQHELIDLLLEGGISTAGRVTEAAGRGIGLDVVREVAQRLGGEVLVRTENGHGATVELVVPMSMAAVESLLVDGGGVVAAIALERVRGVRRVALNGISRGPAGDSVVSDGRLVPFVSLASLLGSDASSAVGRRSTGSLVTAVSVVGHRGEIELGVDRLLGIAPLVVSVLPALAPAATFVAGVWSDTERRPHLMLDPDGLVAGTALPRTTPMSPPATVPLPLLVIDDSLTTRMLEQSILESAGYEVDLAVCAEEALDKAQLRRYGLFLVDIEMPGMDGFTFIERTLRDPALSQTPSILVSSRNSTQDRLRADAVGARGYVVKAEFDQRDLLARIRDLVAM
jgi:two-component system chemotaxis sensor kinase CheA